VAWLLPLALAACGASKAASPPRWEEPTDLGGATYQGGSSLAGDGHGRLATAWLRRGANSTTEVVAVRMGPDGRWSDPQVLEVSDPPSGLQAPAVAVDSRGKGSIGWLAPLGGGSWALRTASVDLSAPSAAPAFGATATARVANLQAPRGLSLAVGSDDSAMAAWLSDRTISEPPVDLSSVQVTRRGGDGGWSTPESYHLNQWSRQDLGCLAAHGQGTYLLVIFTGDDAFVDAEARAFGAGAAVPQDVAGWEPAVRYALPVHESALATDGLGGLEAWLLYDGDTQVYPRQGTASGAWTVGDPVPLPLPATILAVTREPGGAGWFAGAGAEGLWVAPLTGVAFGAPQVLLGPAAQVNGLVAARDFAGAPALMWIQTRDGAVLGLGFTRWDGKAWTTPELVPGSAGAAVAGLSVAAGPSGLVAVWREDGAGGARLRSARWH
jgi:hypothetical protein